MTEYVDLENIIKYMLCLWNDRVRIKPIRGNSRTRNVGSCGQGNAV